MTGEHDDGPPPTTNEVSAPGGVRDVVQAGRIGRYIVNHPLHSLLAALTGAALVLAGAVAWSTLGGPEVEGAANGSPTTATAEPTIGQTTEPAAEPTTTTTTTTKPTTTTAEPTTTTTSSSTRPAPAPARELWQGTVKLHGDGGPRGGWFFDEADPKAGFTMGDLAYGGAGTVTSHKVADLPDDASPHQPRCAELLRATAGITRAPAHIGNAFCFTTRGGRVGHAVVTGTSPRDPLDPSITVDVVVWDLPG
ncbi:hypothetical protein AB0K14_36310 [Actinosynnema sp. NPDC050801]|uniref:hypothetical protein n=1 Tax=unclassified Actinosynnema TaxID=2637065 RepID=UPI0033E8D62C